MTVLHDIWGDRKFTTKEVVQAMTVDAPFGAWSTKSDNEKARAETGKPLHLLEGHASFVQGVAWSRGGQHIATVGLDGTVRLWSLPDGRPLAGSQPDAAHLLRARNRRHDRLRVRQELAALDVEVVLVVLVGEQDRAERIRLHSGRLQTETNLSSTKPSIDQDPSVFGLDQSTITTAAAAQNR